MCCTWKLVSCKRLICKLKASLQVFNVQATCCLLCLTCKLVSQCVKMLVIDESKEVKNYGREVKASCEWISVTKELGRVNVLYLKVVNKAHVVIVLLLIVLFRVTRALSRDTHLRHRNNELESTMKTVHCVLTKGMFTWITKWMNSLSHSFCVWAAKQLLNLLKLCCVVHFYIRIILDVIGSLIIHV